MHFRRLAECLELFLCGALEERPRRFAIWGHKPDCYGKESRIR